MEIFDARPLLNARTNKLKGGGYEDCGPDKAYSNCKITFGDIDNIHAVREAYEKVHDLASLYTCKISDKSLAQYFHSVFDASNYRLVIMRILSCVGEILHSLSVKQYNILVHCSDGWDRTA